MAHPLHQKCIQVASGGINQDSINTVLTAQAAQGWRFVGAVAYGIQTFLNPGGVYLFFIED